MPKHGDRDGRYHYCKFCINRDEARSCWQKGFTSWRHEGDRVYRSCVGCSVAPPPALGRELRRVKKSAWYRQAIVKGIKLEELRGFILKRKKRRTLFAREHGFDSAENSTETGTQKEQT